MSEHQKLFTDLHLAHSFDEKIDFDWNPTESNFAKFTGFIFGRDAKPTKIIRFIKSLGIRKIKVWPTGLASKYSTKLFWTRCRLSRSFNSSQSRLQAIENMQNNQEIHWTGHNSSARRVFADPSAGALLNFWFLKGAMT